MSREEQTTRKKTLVSLFDIVLQLVVRGFVGGEFFGGGFVVKDHGGIRHTYVRPEYMPRGDQVAIDRS
jgi:hypothetical protein